MALGLDLKAKFELPINVFLTAADVPRAFLDQVITFLRTFFLKVETKAYLTTDICGLGGYLVDACSNSDLFPTTIKYRGEDIRIWNAEGPWTQAKFFDSVAHYAGTYYMNHKCGLLR